MDAMGRGDVDAVVDLLAQDAVWSMPPLASWYRGRDEIAVFLANAPLNGEWRWRHLPTRANGQAAVGRYAWDEGDQTHRPFALDVLTLRDDGSRDHLVHHADDRAARRPELLRLARPAGRPREAGSATSRRFGLPDRLD